MSMTNFDKEKFKAFAQSVDLSNLMVVVPTIRKFAERYKIDDFIANYDANNPTKQAQNNLGFILMDLRDFYKEFFSQ